MIFISRELPADSPLRQWAADRDIPLLARSLLRFEPVPFTAPAADWWFFYSPRAVEFALAQQLPGAGVRLAAMGPGTAVALAGKGLKPDFTGDGQPASVSTAFAGEASGRRVFFPRARQSRRSVQTALADRCTVLDAICYDNVAVPPTTPIIADIYIYTSPLNVAACLDTWTREMGADAGATFIAIGPSTAAALRRRGIQPGVAATPTEEGILAVLEN